MKFFCKIFGKSKIWLYLCFVKLQNHKAMKTIKVLLINPANQTVTQIEIENSLQGIYKAMDCRMFECPVELPNGDAVYCDEEGKLNREKLIGGFTYPKAWNDIVMNKALVIGTNHNTGASVDCKSTPAEILNSKEWGRIAWSPKHLAEKYLDEIGF